jgi:hypothetical protein
MEASRADDADFGLTESEALELRELMADDPRLVEELERIHGWDAVIGAAFQGNVEAPRGLADRLKAATAKELDQAVVVPVPLNPEPRITTSSRRAFIALAAAASVLLIVSASAWRAWNEPRQIASRDLQVEMEQLPPSELPVEWQALEELPANIVPTDIRPGRVQRWGRLATAADAQAYVFDLVHPGSPRAVLIAIRAESDLPSAAPRMPQSATGGHSIGMWQSQDFVYVLVVKGNAARYQLFLKDPGQLTAI